MTEATPSFWTDERTAELKERWRNGQTGSEIMRAMGAASRNAVVGKVYRLGLDTRIAIAAKNAKNTRNGIRARQRARKTIHHIDGHVFIVNGEAGMIEEQPPDFKNPVRFIELKDWHCRWPGAGEAGPDLLCCAAPAIDGYPYCAAHCRMAYQPSMPRPPKAPRL